MVLLLRPCLRGGLDLHQGWVVAGGLRQDEVIWVMVIAVVPVVAREDLVVGEAPEILALDWVPSGGPFSVIGIYRVTHHVVP